MSDLINFTLSRLSYRIAYTYVTSSAKRDLIAEETVSSKSSCFYTFEIVFFIETAQGARKRFPIDAH